MELEHNREILEFIYSLEKGDGILPAISKIRLTNIIFENGAKGLMMKYLRLMV